jgi:hypothetical protein
MEIKKKATFYEVDTFFHAPLRRILLDAWLNTDDLLICTIRFKKESPASVTCGAFMINFNA